MTERKETRLETRRSGHDPFGVLRQMTAELDRMFDEPFWRPFRLPARFAGVRTTTWSPEIDVFERDHRLVTKIDLPGMKKQDLTIEVADGHLAISGERKSEVEEKKESFYRSERAYGSFCRVIPLPEGVQLDDVKATFADGVLEVSLPLPEKAEPTVRTVEIDEGTPPAKAA